jgi:adenosylcobinamide-GDP ribazoletransferase
MPHQWRLVLVAVQYFTRVPVPAMPDFDPRWLGESARYFSLVGWLVGAVAALAWLAASLLFPPPVAAGITLATSALLTGAFHEDGLADSFDALGGVVPRERALAIMRDSRIGSYGSLALLLVTGLRWLALAALPTALGAAALLALHPAARAGSASLMHGLPYARDDDSKAKPVAEGMDDGQLLWVVAFGAAPACALVALQPDWAAPLLLALFALVGLRFVLAAWYRQRLGGYTGDTLGCAEQLGELLFLLVVLAVWGVA